MGAAVKVGLICFDGYTMYQAAMEEQSLESRVTAVQAQENFTELEKVSTYFTEALVAVEDRDFYNHGAFSVKSIGRAVLTNLKNREYKEGGSTITQQVAKKSLFFHGKKYEPESSGTAGCISIGRSV